MAKPLKEIILRKYETPREMDKRKFFKHICLSLGLLQPQDRRDTIVDVLIILFDAYNDEQILTLPQIQAMLVGLGIEEGIAESNIRRHLRRFIAIGLVERIHNKYRFSEGESLSKAFEKITKAFIIDDTVNRISEYLVFAEDTFKS